MREREREREREKTERKKLFITTYTKSLSMIDLSRIPPLQLQLQSHKDIEFTISKRTGGNSIEKK